MLAALLIAASKPGGREYYPGEQSQVFVDEIETHAATLTVTK